MFKFREIMVALLIALLLCPVDVFARGGRGGGGRGGGGRAMGGGGYRGGGGGYRGGGSISRAPSMSRPSMPTQSRPSPSRPSSSRPNVSRPSTGAIGSRPAGGAGARPGTGAAGRPGAGNIAGSGRPSAGQLSSFLDIPSQGARPGAGRPSAGNLPTGGNAAVADFFQGGGGRTAAAAGAGVATGAVAGDRAGQRGDRVAESRSRADGAGSIADNRSDRIGDRTDARSDLRDSRGENRDFASDNRQDRLQGRGDRQAARVENRGDYRSSLAQGRGDRRTERQQQLGDRADNIRGELSDRFDENHLFEDFWREHPNAYVNFHQNPVFWTWATFATVSAFMPWNWGTGYYYDYGSGGSAGYSSDTGTMYADEATYSSPEYCEQAEQLATSAPEQPPADTEWLSLGVFAMTTEDNSGALPNMFLQLAVSKDGIIAGTYQNKTTGKTESLDGMVDKESQRAAWTIYGKNTPIMETGLSNLTMNETQALVHFADGTTQRWLLVRVAKPEDQQAKTTSPAGQP